MKICIRLNIIIYLFIVNSLSASSLFSPSDSIDTDVIILDSTFIAEHDSLMIYDSLMTPEGESLAPIEQIAFLRTFEYGTQLDDKDFFTEDYRTSSDLITYLPFGFLQDLGQLGQPNEQMLYGLGFGNIGYNRDGVLLNNPWQNSYDLNKLSFERTDSMDIQPLTRGFLFDKYNNPVSVNFYTRDYFTPRPVTRLKFYQASYDEGFVDLLFHTYVTKRFDFGVGLTVSGIDSRFYNSDYESWKLNGKFGYMFSKDIFLRANYYFTYDSLALNGGLPAATIENGLYSDVLYRNRYQLSTNHFADVKLLANIFPNSKTDITVFYQYDKQKFRQNIDSSEAYIPFINHDNSFQTIGASFRNDYKNDYFNLLAAADYSITDYSIQLMNTSQTENIFTLAGQLQLTPLGSTIVPTGYVKYSNYYGNNFLGFGADVNISLNNRLILFGGISLYAKPHSIMERYYTDPNNLPTGYIPQSNSDKSKVSTLEIALKFNLDFLDGNLSYFTYKNSNAFKPIINNYADTLIINEVEILENYSQSISGFNVNFNFKFWNLIFSNNINYYFDSGDDNLISHPNFSVAGKLYYVDMLFENNLKLKAGINYRFTGEQPYFIYDIEKSMQARFVTVDGVSSDLLNDKTVPQTFQLDLYFAGTIQELATIFIVLENVIDNEYYIVPYYYKQPQMLRLGVSWILFD